MAKLQTNAIMLDDRGFVKVKQNAPQFFYGKERNFCILLLLTACLPGITRKNNNGIALKQSNFL